MPMLFGSFFCNKEVSKKFKEMTKIVKIEEKIFIASERLDEFQ